MGVTLQVRKRYLGGLEPQLEQLGGTEGRHAVVVERLVCPDCVLHIPEVQERVPQGADAGREDSPVGQLPKLVEDLEQALHGDVGSDVAQPHAGAGRVGCLPVQVTLAFEVLLPRRRAAKFTHVVRTVLWISPQYQEACRERGPTVFPHAELVSHKTSLMALPIQITAIWTSLQSVMPLANPASQKPIYFLLHMGFNTGSGR